MPLFKQDHYVQFFTAVCKDWLPLLEAEAAKMIIIDALQYRVQRGQVKVCSYVIMPNHIHFIWRISENLKREDFQRDFLKITAKNIIQYFHQNHDQVINNLRVNAADRNLQVWKRDSMPIDLYTDKFFKQKLRLHPFQSMSAAVAACYTSFRI